MSEGSVRDALSASRARRIGEPDRFRRREGNRLTRSTRQAEGCAAGDNPQNVPLPHALWTSQSNETPS